MTTTKNTHTEALELMLERLDYFMDAAKAEDKIYESAQNGKEEGSEQWRSIGRDRLGIQAKYGSYVNLRKIATDALSA